MEEKDETKTLPIDLILNQDGTATYTINEQGEVQGGYTGTFILKCFLTPLDVLSAGRQYRDLLGQFGSTASETEKFIAFSLSQLSKRIVKSPPWWNTDSAILGNIPDLNILSLLLDRAMDSEIAYKQRLKKKKTEALDSAKSSIEAIQDRLNKENSGE
jgi:hypothetical protein